MKQQTGFSLIELTATVAILVVLTGIAAPSMTKAIKNSNTHDRVFTLTASLSSARMAAIQRRTAVTVCPSADGLTCRSDANWSNGWIVYADPNRDTQPASASAVLHHIQQHTKSIQVYSSTGRQRVRFQPSGMAGGNNLTLRVCDQTGTPLAAVVVNNAGRVRSQRVNDPENTSSTNLCPNPMRQ